MQTVYIDLIPQNIKPVINASQFDDKRLVRFMLIENGEAFTLAGTETVTVNIRKPDRNIVVITPTIEANNYVDVYFTEQACACYGTSFGELVIDDGNAKIGTCNFDLDVEISPVMGGIESASVIDDLATQISGIAADEIAEIAPGIIAEIAPSVIGDDYYTKAQIQSNYYNKEQSDLKFEVVKPRALFATLYTGQVQKKFFLTSPITDAYLIEVYASDYGVTPSNVQYVEERDPDTQEITFKYIQVDFDEAFDHNLTLCVHIIGPTNYKETN